MTETPSQPDETELQEKKQKILCDVGLGLFIMRLKGFVPKPD